MKLLLVSPSPKFRKKLKAIKIPQLSLHILASLTPNDVDITVADEEIREIDFSLDFDLVGISCMTATANRSYELSDMFRQGGSQSRSGRNSPRPCAQEAIQQPMQSSSERQKAVGPMSSATLEAKSSRNPTMYQNLIFQSFLSRGVIFILTRRYLTVSGW